MIKTDPLETTDEKDRNFITALARGLDVLRCFRANDRALGNQDIAHRTGLPKPTISRLTHTLCALDYLSLEVGSGMYRLGPGVLTLGFGVLSGMDMAERAADVMKSLRNGPNSYITCAMAERHRADAVYVAVERSREDVALTMHVGARLPLFFSAIGRAILVALPPDQRLHAFQCATQDYPNRADQLDTVYDSARRDYDHFGYCRGYGEWRRDVNGVAVPVVSLDGARIFALNVGGPSFHVKKKALENVYAGLLKQARARLEGNG